jgi:hypothetical protein
VYVKAFLAERGGLVYRDWVLDSGAFSAHTSGTHIDLDAYIAFCKHMLGTDTSLTEVFALDVIGNPEASRVNCEKMWEAGVPAIPCFHYGSPVEFLTEMARRYPKIAIGGCATMASAAKLEFAKQVFARVWPKKIHGFGFGTEEQILTFPFHSVDASTWEMGPCAFGRWRQFGKLSVRGGKQNLKGEIRAYMEIEARARVRWRKEMSLLEGGSPPTVRLAVVSSRATQALRRP